MNKISDMSESHPIFSGEQPRQAGVEVSPTVGGEKLSYNLENSSKMNSLGLATEKTKYDMVKKKTKLNEGYDLNPFPNPL